MTRWQWLLSQFSRQLWVRATFIGFLGILAALLAAVVQAFVPFDLPTQIGANAVETILSILASSMLAVTTFTLSIMTAAYGAATSNVTPRATRLLIEDRTTQNVLSTFIGSFLFGMVGIVVLKTGAYDAEGRFVLFVVTVAVIAMVVAALLRWIDQLTRLGRVGETTQRVEDAARSALETRIEQPFLGGRPLVGEVSPLMASGPEVRATRIGYVQHVDIALLDSVAKAYGAPLVLLGLPGVFLYGVISVSVQELPPSIGC